MKSLAAQAHRLLLLRYVHETGSLRKAAVLADLTPSSASQSLGVLEKDIGESLLVRSRSGLKVSPAGLTLLNRVAPALHLLEEPYEKSKGPGTVPSKLSMGAYDSIAISLFPKILPALREKYPTLRLQVFMGRTHRLYAQVQSGELDMALVIEDGERRSLDTHRIGEERLGLYVSALHSSSFRGKSISDLGLATLNPGPDGYPRYYSRFIKGLEKNPVAVLTDSFEAVRAFVSTGSVIGILPTRVAARYPEELRELPHTGAAASKHHFALIARKNLDPAKLRWVLSEIQGAFSELPKGLR